MPAIHDEQVVYNAPCVACHALLPATHFWGRENLTAVCPECHSPLGTQTGIYEEIIVPIIGRRSTGKSAYLAALVDTLQRFFGNRISFPFPGVADQVEQNIKSYKRGENPAQTTKGFPSGFVIDIKKSRVQKHEPPSVRLLLYDIAGEMYNDEKEMDNLKFFDFMDGLIILIDPLTVLDVRRQYKDQMQMLDMTTFQVAEGDFEETVHRIRNGLIERYRYRDYDSENRDGSRTHVYLKLGQTHYAKCAVVITKTDIFDLDSQIGDLAVRHKMRSNSWMNYENALDLVCREHLENWGLGNELSLLGDMFDEVRCFSVTAFGHMPGRGKRFKPKRVELPLFWCLQEHINSLLKL